MKKENKDLLIPLLEKCLNVEIKDIKYLNLEDLVDNVHVRRKSYDLRLETNIGIIQLEMNSNVYDYSHVRQVAYISNEYSHYTSTGEDYNGDIQIIQINFVYGLMTNFTEEKYKDLYDEDPFGIYEIRKENGKKYVDNYKIYEFNMDYYMNLWYTKNTKEIEDNKLFIMMDLKLNELASISKDDKVVSKYMEELERINKDPKFIHFMSEEEDRRKLENTMKRREREIGMEEGITFGREEGITLGREEGRKEKTRELVKNLYCNHVDIKTLSESTGLSIEEIKTIIEES